MRGEIWAGFTAVCALAFLTLSHSQGPWARRSAFVAGLLALATLELLGIIWPSLYTVAGLVVLPCVVVFLVGLARPQLMARKWVVIYGSLAVLVSAVSAAHQAGHLVGLDAVATGRVRGSETGVDASGWRPPLAPPRPDE